MNKDLPLVKVDDCCEAPNIVHGKNPDVFFQGMAANGEWKTITMEVECTWCANCGDISMLNQQYMAKKKHRFTSFDKIAYTDWVDTDSDEFECDECSEPISFPDKKCPDCGTTYTYEYGSLELIRPIVKKRRKAKPAISAAWATAPGLVGPPGRISFKEKETAGSFIEILHNMKWGDIKDLFNNRKLQK